jgi:uncharacterized protein
MLFAIIALDKPDHVTLRLHHRPDHLAHMQGFADQIRFAGPFLSDGEPQPIGSLIVLEAPDKAAVEAFLAADPYTQAGLFQSVEIKPCRQALPAT